jgi:hypothetical protein
MRATIAVALSLFVGTHEVGTPVSQKDSPLTCPEVRERN